jgi:NAD(P)-dependent dehydrogenase (short-subunit alcohol dehydrogenase family)
VIEKTKNVLSLFKLDGKKAIVTGAGRGLGREISLGLAEAGADIAVVDFRTDECSETAEMILKLGRKSIALNCNVTKEEDVKSMVEQTMVEFGRIDILVCNAGFGTWSAAEEMEFTTWQKIIDVNLNGVFLCCKWVGREMIKKKKGSIINISSVSAYTVPVPQKQCHYNSSKAGVVQLTKSLAVEWAQYNIRVNVLCPGYIMTPLISKTDPEMLKKWTDMTPQHRIPDSSELKGIVVFLASQAASYLTGSSIIVDGGYSLQ